MTRLMLGLAVVLGLALPAYAQSTESELRRLVPYSALAAKVPGLTILDYNDAIRSLAREIDEADADTTPALPTYQTPAYRRYVPPTPTYRAPAYRAPTYTPPSSGTTYDWKSGNVYRWNRQSDGTMRVDGMNPRTGSMWNQTIKPDGSMRGTDSNFNQWSYDPRSKLYMNYGTGKICTGQGYARVCTP